PEKDVSMYSQAAGIVFFHDKLYIDLVCSAYHTFFFFNDTATTEIYTLSLHDALPISQPGIAPPLWQGPLDRLPLVDEAHEAEHRSEEHTSELQSLRHLVCRLLLEKKKKTINHYHQECVRKLSRRRHNRYDYW